MFKKLGEVLRGVWESHCEIQGRMRGHYTGLIPGHYFVPDDKEDENVRDH